MPDCCTVHGQRFRHEVIDLVCARMDLFLVVDECDLEDPFRRGGRRNDLFGAEELKKRARRTECPAAQAVLSFGHVLGTVPRHGRLFHAARFWPQRGRRSGMALQ